MSYYFTEDYFDLDTIPTGAGQGPFTYHCWANPDQTDANDALMGSLDTVSGDYTSLQIMDTNDEVWAKGLDSGTTNATSVHGTSYTSGSWQSFGFTLDSAGTATYSWYNGVIGPLQSGDFSGLAVPDTFQIGETGGGSPFTGYMAEIAIWNVDLDAAELAALGAGYSALLIRPANLIYYAPLRSNTNDLIGGVTLTGTGPPVVNAIHPNIIMPSAQILQFPSAAAPVTASALVLYTSPGLSVTQ